MPSGRCAISTATYVPPPPQPKPADSAAAPPSASAAPVAKPAPLSNASAVVAAAAAGFRRCYNKALAEDTSETGTVRVTARIDAEGCVASTSATSQQLHDRTVACVVDRVRQMEFEAPEGGGATIVIPVTLVSK